MYDVGQGNNIKDKPHVFEIDFSETIADTSCPCGKKTIDKSQVPIQYPLGYFDKSGDGIKEDYIDTSQHTNAGEPSDLILLSIAIVLMSVSIWLFLRK